MTPSRNQERRNDPERRVGRIYRFFERRTRFDRRKRHLFFGTIRDNPWILVLVLVTVNALSLLDAWFTAVELGMGIAREGNPVLAGALEVHPLLALAVKVGVMALVTVGIWHGRRRKDILQVAIVALIVYGAVVAYHWGNLHALGLL